MKKILKLNLSSIIFCFILIISCAQDVIVPSPDIEVELISTEVIWDSARHNAFTDLILYQDHFYCTFRESVAHAVTASQIRILRSKDGSTWQSEKVFQRPNADLRDPKFFVFEGKLYVNYRVNQLNEEKERVAAFNAFSSSVDGDIWTDLKDNRHVNKWLWRVTPNDEVLYSIGYLRESGVSLYWDSSIDFKNKILMNVDKSIWPSEATIRFTNNGQMIFLIRTKNERDKSILGKSYYPYSNFEIKEIDTYLGGPNFLILNDDLLLVSGRVFINEEWRTQIGCVFHDYYFPLYDLPSGLDNGYPGMVIKEDTLYLTYYSQHLDNKTKIYFSKFKLDY